MEINYSLKLELTGSDIQALKNILLDSSFKTYNSYDEKGYYENKLINELLEELGAEE